MAYNLHDLRVKGIRMAGLLDCVIEGGLGEHSTLILKGYPESGQEMLYELPAYQPVEVYQQGESGETLLFYGVITDMSLEESAELQVIRVEASSSSLLLDLTKKSRSFQDTGMSYRELAEQVLAGYPGSALLYAAPEAAIGTLIVQYEETDWVFLNRVLSRIGVCLTPEISQTGILVYAGIPELPEINVPFQIRSMDKDLDRFYYLKANGHQVKTVDFTKYEIVTDRFVGMFWKVVTRSGNLTVDSYRYDFGSQELTGIYGLQGANGLVQDRQYPMHMIGLALLGKVTNVAENRVQVMLDIDQGTPPVYWFIYSTISASPDGSGWYCMPENGDAVRVYFPSKYEKEAIALSAVNGYDVPSEGQDRMQDPNTRYLKTKSGQELAMSPGQMSLSCGGGSSITIQNDGSVIVSAGGSVTIAGGEKVTLHAEEKLNVEAAEALVMESLPGASVSLAGGVAQLEGSKITFD